MTNVIIVKVKYMCRYTFTRRYFMFICPREESDANDNEQDV